MRVMITGGAGRLGINVDKAFIKGGYQVRVFDLNTPLNRKSVKKLGGKAEINWGDITRPDSVREALKDVDAVVHMAGILPPVAYEVLTSSVAAFGPTPDASEPLCPEEHDANPRGAYGETKLQAEKIIKESGIEYVILRLTATMYLNFSLSDLKRMFSVPLNNRVEYCHPDDTASAIFNAIDNFYLVKGNTLVISGGPEQRMLYKDMVGAILRVLGLPLPPARKFTKEPYYLDWYDTTKSQKLLNFQHRSFSQYIKDYSKQLSRQYGPGFIPFMRRFVGPVFGKAIVQLF
jgi:UDP-glucose 4-epimerase